MRNRALSPRLDIDWIRGMAAIFVVISHLFVFYPTGRSGFFLLSQSGHVAVDVFFVLSGFLIALSWDRTQEYRDFYRARARRILPLMWTVMVVVFFVLAPIFYGWFPDTKAHFLVMLTHFFGLQSALPLAIPGLYICAPLWTLTVEISFYAVLPWIWRAFTRHPASSVSLCFLIEVLWIVFSQHVVEKYDLNLQFAVYLPLQMPGQMFSFSIGMLLAFFHLKNAFYLTRTAAIALRWSGMIGLALSVAFYGENRSLFLDPIFSGLLIFSCISGGQAVGNSAARSVDAPLKIAFTLLGKISYSLYLWHFPVLFTLFRITKGNLPLYAFAFIGVSVSVFVALISYLHIESVFLYPHAASRGRKMTLASAA